jgi:hypothetical protein
MFNCDGGPSLAEKFQRRGVIPLPADNTRVGKVGAASGWDSIRQRLIGMDDTPMLYFFSTCTNVIRTLPMMVHDQRGRRISVRIRKIMRSIASAMDAFTGRG